jgi:hypothetical protein
MPTAPQSSQEYVAQPQEYSQYAPQMPQQYSQQQYMAQPQEYSQYAPQNSESMYDIAEQIADEKINIFKKKTRKFS